MDKENKDQCKSGKKCEDLIRKAFPSLPRIMQGDNDVHDRNRKSQIILNHKPFTNQFEYWLKHDLSNASNYVRVALRGGSRMTAAISTMERFVIIVNGWKPLTIITKRSNLDVAAFLDAPLALSSIKKVPLKKKKLLITCKI